jgi:hypothetical protein
VSTFAHPSLIHFVPSASSFCRVHHHRSPICSAYISQNYPDPILIHFVAAAVSSYLCYPFSGHWSSTYFDGGVSGRSLPPHNAHQNY